MKIEENEVYTTREVAEILKVSLPTIKRMLKDKRLPSTRIGKQHRFLGRDLIDLLSTQKPGKRGRPRTGETPGESREAPPVAAAAPAKKAEAPQPEPISTAEARQRAYMTGKSVVKNIYEEDGSLLFEQGCIVTESMIETAKRKKKLMELFSNLEHEG